jgi:heme exporter protein B
MFNIKALLQYELLTEWRNRHALNGVLLYLAATIFICYLSFKLKRSELSPATWNALYWIVIVFSAVSTTAKSFLGVSEGRLIYQYTLAHPVAVILSKMIYHALLLSLVSLGGLAFYAFVMGNPIQDAGLFVLNVVLGSVGLGAAFSMIAAIAAKAGNNMTLMSVLGFPVIIPILLILIKISKNALDGLAWSVSYGNLVILGALDVIVIITGCLLFPYLWRS